MFEGILEIILVKEVVYPIVAILISVFIYNIIIGVLKKLFQIKSKHVDEKRKETIFNFLRNVIRILIVLITLLTILKVYGIDTTSIITSLSVIGVVVGLAFQDLIKDFIAGVSIVIEGQYRVGDTVQINGFKGEVINVGLKSTKLKAYTGEIMILANRLITDVINYNLSDSLALIDIKVSLESDIEKTEKVLNELCERLSKELPYLKGKVELLGVNSIEESFIKFRMTALTESMKHYAVQRQMLREVKLELDKNKIEIPYNQMVVRNG